MNKTLYIHIGTGKTGTTTIQNFLEDNKDKLEQIYNCHFAGTHIFSYNGTCHPQRTRHEGFKIVSDFRKNLRTYIKQSNTDKFLISSEYFPGEKIEEIENLKEMYSDVCNVKIIVYLRCQDSFIYSWFTQMVKTSPEDGTDLYLRSIQSLIDELYSANILNYEKLLEPWSDVFGTENILVNTFPPKEDLLENFFKKNLDIDVNFKDLDVSFSENGGIKPEQIVFIQTLLPKLNEEKKEDLIKIIQEPFDIDFNYRKSLIPPAQRKEILNDFDKFNDNVAKKYLNRDKLFDDLTMDDEETWEYPDIIKNGYYDLAIKYLKEKHEIHIN